MAKLSDHQSSGTTKGMILGDSGSGKSGALVSLAMAGYNLRVMDWDNGIDILRNLLRPLPTDGSAPIREKAAALDRINYVTLTDRMKVVGGKVQPITANAWMKGVNLLSDWKEDNLGPVTTWGSKDVLVCDSLTFAGKASLRYILSINGRLNAERPFQSDFGEAQTLIENFLGMLYSEDVKCNVLVLSHVRELGKVTTIQVTNAKGEDKAVQVEEPGTQKGYAETGTGRALSPIVGRYFNSVLMTEITGQGTSARRELVTVPTGNIGLKNSAPGLVKPRYPLATGLAEYFAAVRNEAPQVADAATQTGAK